LGAPAIGDARQVALHVGGEHRHAGVGEGLGHDLQGDGLAGAGRAGHHAVAIGAIQPLGHRPFAKPDQDFAFADRQGHTQRPSN
jgi:hypothetical protein